MRRVVHRNSPRLGLGLLHKIVLEAAGAHTLEEQIERLVHGVSHALSVDVCSLYQIEPDHSLRMVANTGLSETAWHTIVLPAGEGLVGLIADTKLPLNLKVAQNHTAYRYFPGSGEEAFQAFLGVPIVHLGSVIGVLVVQDQDQRGFTADEESFLITMAAQLSGSMLRLPLADSHALIAMQERSIRGINGAPGQALGKVHLLIGEQTLNLLDEPVSQGTDAEVGIFTIALSRAQEEIQAGKSRFNTVLSSDVLGIFDFYDQLLSSDQLTQDIEGRIRSGMSAFAATRKTFDEYVTGFDTVEDDYIRSRADDVRHIGHKLLAAVLGQTTDQTSDDQHLVLLGEDVSVSDIARFDPTQLVAIVCLQGSALSHSAVLARALGIPAVVATGPIDHIKNEDAVIVDGDLGIVVLSPSQSTQSAYATIVEAARSFDESLLADKDLPAVTKDGFRVQLFANTGLLADVSPGIKRGAEGIGLYRSEIPFLAHEAFPTESEQYQVYHTILTAYHPRPVTMRTLDIGSDKQLPYMNIKENNPALGWRGIRFSLDNRAVLVTQLRAMLKADIGLGNLQIMLPMITSNAETREVAAVLDSVVTRLQAEGEPVTRPDLGIMVEVPGVIPLLRGQKEWIDFISIGTNDLTQYLLAVDRTNPRVSTLYDHLHPAMIQTMADLAKTAETLQLRVSVCGEMAADPYAAVLLIGMRFPALSMNAFSIPRIKALTRGLTVEEAQICLTDVLTMDDPQDIRQRVHATLVDAGLDHLIYRGASPEPSEVGSG